jgi:predicted DNA-binding transcriptional regulator YafY
MAAPRYVERIARLPEVLRVLAEHPEGMALVDLAERQGIPPDELREDLLAYYTADLGDWTFGLSRPATLEFLGAGDADADPHTAGRVRLVDDRPAADLGVEYVTAAELALLFTAAQSLRTLTPDDDSLTAAMGKLERTMLGETTLRTTEGYVDPGEARVVELRTAIEDHHAVRISYSRAWSAGVSRLRLIHPYALVHTHRGWEVDAGPPDEHGQLRTFLVPHLVEMEITSLPAEPPKDLEAMLAEHRRRTSVRMQLPHEARWAADMYAEAVHVVQDDDETFTADVEMLPPVEARVGLIMLAGGDETRVISPPGLIASGPALARQLLEHHRVG